MINRTHAQSGDWQAGFTLIELLVGLTLFSLLSIILLESVWFGIRAWQRSNTYTDQMADGLQVQTLLRRMIENAYPLFLSSNALEKRIDFDGRKNTLIFLTSTPIALGAGGRSRILLATEQHGTDANLILTAWPELGRQDNRSEPTILLEGLKDATFSYFGKTPPNTSAKWHDDWLNQPELPQLIKIHLQFSSDDAHNWPDLIVAPKISVDVSCAYDSLTGRCRGR
jgi:general secretion pathway protein J